MLLFRISITQNDKTDALLPLHQDLKQSINQSIKPFHPSWSHIDYNTHAYTHAFDKHEHATTGVECHIPQVLTTLPPPVNRATDNPHLRGEGSTQGVHPSGSLSSPKSLSRPHPGNAGGKRSVVPEGDVVEQRRRGLALRLHVCRAVLCPRARTTQAHLHAHRSAVQK